MLEDMNALNEELSLCLKTALREKANLQSYDRHFKNREEKEEILDKPLESHYSLLIAFAEELEVLDEVYSIMLRWQLRRNPKPTPK